MEKTLGERRVRTGFNVSQDSEVDAFKVTTARLIDLAETHRKGSDSEKIRLIALAQTHYEDAAMWIVKALTYQPPQ